MLIEREVILTSRLPLNVYRKLHTRVILDSKEY